MMQRPILQRPNSTGKYACDVQAMAADQHPACFICMLMCLQTHTAQHSPGARCVCTGKKQSQRVSPPSPLPSLLSSLLPKERGRHSLMAQPQAATRASQGEFKGCSCGNQKLLPLSATLVTVLRMRMPQRLKLGGPPSVHSRLRDC